MAAKKLTCTCVLDNPDGTVTRFEDIPPDEMEALREHLTDRMTKAFQDYFKTHPEEF